MALCLLSAAPLRGEDVPAMDEIVETWRNQSAAYEIQWTYGASGFHRFQECQSDWVSSTEPPKIAPETLVIDGNRFRFEAVQRTMGEHGYDPFQLNAAHLIETFPERKQDPFVAALESRFSDPRAQFQATRPFLRGFDGVVVRDYWPRHAGEYPRGIIRHALPLRVTIGELPVQTKISNTLQELSLVAAILAVNPMHPSLASHWEGFEVEAGAVLADGKPCLVLTDAGSEDVTSQTIVWVDPADNYVIRRLIASTGRVGYQIDIRYGPDQSSRVPTEWTVCSFGEEPGAMQAVHAVVTKLAPRGPLTGNESEVRFAPGTWVIDATDGGQYILRDDGTPRDIHSSEFDWLPTYSELEATEAGQVGELVERNLRWTQYWRMTRVPVIFGVASIACGIALAIWRRVRDRRNSLIIAQ